MLYFAQSGIFWTEEVEDEGDWFLFNLDRTLAISDIGDKGFRSRKLTKTFGLPTIMRIPASNIIAIQDVTDNELITKLRASLAGIIIAEAGNPSN